MLKLRAILERIKENKKVLEFLPTGFPLLDAFLDGGFIKKELVVIGAHTGYGKSFIAAQIFYNLAQNGFKSAYFSLEISNETIVTRLIGSLSNIKATRVTKGLFSKPEYDEKVKAEARLELHEPYMDFYDDLYELKDIKKAIQEHDYDFVVIDFIQNVFVNGMQEYERLSYVSLELQRLAKEKNCCILVLSQLSNRVAANGSPVVEYKGSGAIAMVCDLGFFIERDSEQKKFNNIFALNLKKNRRGTTAFNFHYQFTDPGGWIKEIDDFPSM